MRGFIHQCLEQVLPLFVWHIPTEDPVIYLTFDDGPTPGVTDSILDSLKQYNAKATFFCLGKQVEQNPVLFQRIITEGHAIGNHTYSHPDGLTVTPSYYLKNIERAQAILTAQQSPTKLFRPPYGRINPLSISKLTRDYAIIMWNNLPHDYNEQLASETVLQNILKKISPGDIVVLHDSKKAADNVLEVVPALLKELCAKNYKFASLEHLNQF